MTQIDERSVLCADVGAFVACTTHLVRASNDAEAHELQLAALVEHARELAAGRRPVVIAADVNDTPARLGELVRSGTYVAAPHTTIDQVVATGAHFRSVGITARSCSCPDHDALLVDLEERDLAGARRRGRLIGVRTSASWSAYAAAGGGSLV